MSEFVTVPGWEPPGPPRRRRAVIVVVVAVVVAAVALVVVVASRGGGAAPGGNPVAAPTAVAEPPTSTALPSDDDSTTPTPTPDPTPSSTSNSSDCTPAAITAGLGQTVTALGLCEFGWAVVGIGDGPGDNTVLARLVGTSWVRYTAFPSMVCRGEAAADGVPPSVLNDFTSCEDAGGPAPGSEDGTLAGVGVAPGRPACDGSGIVVLGSATTPGRYAEDVSDFLSRFPGASYLRTDLSCPSLRPATAAGDPIFAVYVEVGSSRTTDICAAVAAAGADAYGKRLDTTSDPTRPVAC